MQKLAIIDLGSNSVRMSIYEINGSEYFETLSQRRMIKLSEGMTGDMLLKPPAIMRAVKALLEFKNIITKNNVSKTVAVATAAVRKAKNSAEFLADIKNAVGIDIEVINGEREAMYDYLAVKHTLGCSKCVICDIGGGSTELIGVNGEMTNTISIPHGSRGITETFFENGETAEAIGSAENFINSLLGKEGWLSRYEGAPIVGIGGCLRSIAKYDLSDFSAQKINKHTINSSRLNEIYETLKNTPLPLRQTMAGIGKERADIIMGGYIPLMCLKNKILAPQLVVSDVGVKDGIIQSFMLGK